MSALFEETHFGEQGKKEFVAPEAPEECDLARFLRREHLQRKPV